MNSNSLILPGDPEFDFTLTVARPPGWQQLTERTGESAVFVADHETGILRAVTGEALTEYLYGGEYDQRLANLEELDNAVDNPWDDDPDYPMADLTFFDASEGI